MEQFDCSLVPQESLAGLNEEAKNQELALFKEYSSIFEKETCDLGRANDVLHHIDTRNHFPIHLSQLDVKSADEVVNTQIIQLVQHGLLVPSKSP